MRVESEPTNSQKKRQARKVRTQAAKDELFQYRSSKGAPKGNGKSKMRHDSNGREICFSWNAKRGDCANMATGQSCKHGRSHVCQICGSTEHPAADCPSKSG
eukprot:6487736-Amphidinium_carterae.1